MDPQVIKKRQELRVLNAEIAERTKYKREQERAISELVESGNTQLMGLHHDILLAKQELRELRTDIRTARQDRSLIYQELEVVQVQPVVSRAPVRLFHIPNMPSLL